MIADAAGMNRRIRTLPRWVATGVAAAGEVYGYLKKKRSPLGLGSGPIDKWGRLL